jgi:hypothetical protein
MHDFDHPILVSVENTDIRCIEKWDVQRAFPLDISMVTSPKLSFIINGNNPNGVSLASSEIIHFGSLEFISDCLGRMNISPYEGDSSAIFIGMVRSGSPSLHTTLEDSSDVGGATLCVGGALDPPAPEGATW